MLSRCQRGSDLERRWRCRPSPPRTAFRRWHRSSATTRCHGRQCAASRPTAGRWDVAAAFSGATAAWPPPVRTRTVPAAQRKQSSATQPVPYAAPAPPLSPQAAPSLLGPAVPVVTPVGVWRASAAGPVYRQGPLVVQMLTLGGGRW